MIGSSGERRSVPGSAARDHVRPEARESTRASVVVCFCTEKGLSGVPATRVSSMLQARMMRLVALSLGTLSATAGYIKEMVPQNARGFGRK
jgi:hypothetical protein